MLRQPVPKKIYSYASVNVSWVTGFLCSLYETSIKIIERYGFRMGEEYTEYETVNYKIIFKKKKRITKIVNFEGGEEGAGVHE